MISMLKRLARKPVRRLLSARTRGLLQFDLLRLRARLLRLGDRGVVPPCDRLHFGCGRRRVDGWLNVDVVGSEYDVDLAGGRLPWKDGAFWCIAAQQVIEHLELEEELLPLFKELGRVCAPGGEIWLACPDLGKVCRAYAENREGELVKDRRSRWPQFSLGGIPKQHIVNVLFHQNGQHKNLYDFDLLRWALAEAGFERCERVREDDFLERFPEFPQRGDDHHSLYVKAFLSSGAAGEAKNAQKDTVR